MAKTDSFFMRQAITLDNNGDFNQEVIDLGAVVDALGRTVARIKNIAVQYSDVAGGSPDMSAASGTAVTGATVAACDFQLTTQSQTALVISGDNKSVIASGRLVAHNERSNTGVPTNLSDEFDIAPQHWSDGYLIGVEQMYLSGRTTTTGWNEDVVVSIVMEMQSETLTQAASMALALSQQ
tara:strand:- start:455 stop:997 length:543 start_codon:yes stop_codon:yes gene_type:complete